VFRDGIMCTIGLLFASISQKEFRRMSLWGTGAWCIFLPVFLHSGEGRHGFTDRLRQRAVTCRTDPLHPRAGAEVRQQALPRFGGKLMFDYHAARVLPGYDPNVKMRLLHGLRDKANIILCIFAGDIERKKIRADFGITYDSDAMKLIDDLKAGASTWVGWSSPASRPALRSALQEQAGTQGHQGVHPPLHPRDIPPTWTSS